MAKQVKWNHFILEKFNEYALLSSDEYYIMESRIKGTPISIQAYYLSVSESTVSRMISMLKKKYDAVQKLHPDELPPRKFSVKETWLDEN